MFENITDKLAKVFQVDTSKQRLDSVHLRSNMKRLSRINVLARTIEKFLRNLKRQHTELYQGLPEKLRECYCSQKAMQCFSMVKPGEAQKTLQQTAEDLYDLAEIFSETPDVISMGSYKILLRVLHEQCCVSQVEGEPLVIGTKPSKEVPSDSLQNPSDEDATYDGHKGQGYQTQVMETFSTTLDPEAKAQELDLVTAVEVETASEHDSAALLPALESAAERGLEPKVSGLNILRATCARKARKKAGTWSWGRILGRLWRIFSFKERFGAVLVRLKIIFLQISSFCSGHVKNHPSAIESAA
jgi:hypothetical protein